MSHSPTRRQEWAHTDQPTEALVKRSEYFQIRFYTHISLIH
jgi:hypothetical protein